MEKTYAIIIAAGSGKRLLPYTEKCPKNCVKPEKVSRIPNNDIDEFRSVSNLTVWNRVQKLCEL